VALFFFVFEEWTNADVCFSLLFSFSPLSAQSFRMSWDCKLDSKERFYFFRIIKTAFFATDDGLDFFFARGFFFCALKVRRSCLGVSWCLFCFTLRTDTTVATVFVRPEKRQVPCVIGMPLVPITVLQPSRALMHKYTSRTTQQFAAAGALKKQNKTVRWRSCLSFRCGSSFCFARTWQRKTFCFVRTDYPKHCKS